MVSLGSLASKLAFLDPRQSRVAALGLGLAALGGLLACRRARRRAVAPPGKAVFITGCDSGLGYSFALHCSSLGLVVFAGVLRPDSPGLEYLKAVGRESGRLRLVRLDLTDDKSVEKALASVASSIEENNYELLAVINNAGIMVFGEFEWLTPDLIDKHISVNLAGTMKFTKATVPLLRKHKGMLITVLSHCALEGLPGLSVYCATKAGLNAWCDSLRVELGKFGVRVVKIIPGGFVSASRLLANQKEFAAQMWSSMDKEARMIYDDYFDRYMSYLGRIPVPQYPVQVENDGLYADLEHALLSGSPRALYVRSPPRYLFYHFLFRWTPTFLRDYLTLEFMSMPEWR